MIGTLPGPLDTWARLLGPGLAGVSWRRLGKAGQGWTRPLGLNRPGLAGKTLWHTQNTLAHSLTGTLLANPWKCCFEHFELYTFFDTFGSFGSFGSFSSFGNLWPHIGHQNVTGPPGALLFDRDQRSHWKNYFNCCFVRVAAWAFITQISCHRC